MKEYIEKQAAIDTVKYDYFTAYTKLERVNEVKSIPAADVVPYSISPDGTLTVTVPKGMKRIGRILIEEDGTQYGGLFYPDTGGCFLSSMERSE